VPDAGQLAAHKLFRPAGDRRFEVRRTGDRTFRVTGAGIDRLVARYDLENEEALAHLERRLRGIGVLRALAAKGFQAGDEVEISGVTFDLDPDV
jgi:GTP-binding protein